MVTFDIGFTGERPEDEEASYVRQTSELSEQKRMIVAVPYRSR